MNIDLDNTGGHLKDDHFAAYPEDHHQEEEEADCNNYLHKTSGYEDMNDHIQDMQGEGDARIDIDRDDSSVEYEEINPMTPTDE